MISNVRYIVSYASINLSFETLLEIDMDVRFKTPANFYICGQSQSGKSYLVRSILYSLNDLFDPVPSKILYCYGEHQSVFDDMARTIPTISFIRGFPPCLYDLLEGYANSLVIIDDLMSECSKDQRISELFTRGSHHRGISVMYLTQNLFPPGKQSRTISLNSHYMIVFKNPRDSLGIATLARQMYPKNVNYLLDSFHDATSKPFGYLLLDMHPTTQENLRLRTNILPHGRQIVYVKRT
jgi:hypothetical protein